MKKQDAPATQQRPIYRTMLFELILLVTVVSVISILLSMFWLNATSPGPDTSPRSVATPRTLTSIQFSTANAYQSIPLTPIVIVNEGPTLAAPIREINDQVLQTNPLVGQLAPDFTLPELNGDEVALSDLRGKPVLLNFWTSWCGPCRIETPLLVDAYERYRNEGLLILGVNYTEQDLLEDVEAFANGFGVTYPILLDREGHISSDAYGLIGLPMSVFVDRAGIVKRVVIGPMTNEQINEYIAEILVENA